MARVEYQGQIRTALINPDATSVGLLPSGTTPIDALTTQHNATEELPIADVRLKAPIEPPTIRDFSVFEQHMEGVRKNFDPSATVPDVFYASPFCYFSNPHALTGPNDEIPIPPGCTDLDLELEVAAVIGRPGKDLRPEQAADHIAGYTIFNDWSARDLQIAEMALGLGICKGKDFANTLGPWIVTPDELEPYRANDRYNLALEPKINGRSLGTDTLAHMAWSFEELVSYASRGTWVKPGDVLGSGTCGYGCLLELWGRFGRDCHPPLQPGDTVELKVQGIGTLTNRVTAGVKPVTLPTARRVDYSTER
ncbi:MAG TPA: fumarylacetoacetate hydrolase family protein [Solirubrobacteraceae bacterium]|nr:fumarylacetoacetate hydrolase family protein [Solirubrobacteraceae bacterium]